MAISFQSSTVSASTASAIAPPVAYPASVAATDGLVLVVGTKPYSGVITTPTDWTFLGTITNGTVASGTDVGSVKAAAYFLEAAGPLTGSLTLAIAGASSSWASMARFSKAAATSWDLGYTDGVDTIANTAWSVTYGALSIVSGDHLVVAGVVPTDVATTWSAHAVAASGATVSAPTALHNPRITAGNDSGGNVSRAVCTAGSSVAAPTWTATLSVGTNQAGSAVLVRLREVSAASVVPAPYVVGAEATHRSHYW